jgi:Relaxase/Mobilisation nuclease domain/Large polyvalent protein-associated domain 7
MIAKRILRPKAASNFARLSAYLLSEKTGPEGDTSSLTFGYILNGSGAAGRVGAVRITNCASVSPSLALKEILATQALNKRSRSDRTYHLVVSFEPGERPTESQLQDIEDTLCEAIGLGAHQRISAVHTDRAHLHLHIAINKVAPSTRRCVEPFYDKRKLMAACEALEKKHGLAQTNHGRSKAGGPKGKPADLEAHAAEASFLSFVKDKIEAQLLEALNGKTNWSEVHALLAKEGLILKRRGAGLIIADAKTSLAVKASSVNPAFSMKELTGRLGPFEGARPPASCTAYGRAPLPRQKAQALYAAYVFQRKEGLEALKKARQASAAARNSIYDGFAEYLKDVKRSGLTGSGKRARRRELRSLRSQALAALDAKAKKQRAEIESAYTFSWIGFLEGQALAGDMTALEALRRSKNPNAAAAVAFLSAADPSHARTILLKDANPQIREGGHVRYQCADGGALTDEAARVRVDKTSYQAGFLALSLAAERFSGQALLIEGTEAFKRQATQIAAALNLPLTFGDSALEEERKELLLTKAQGSPAFFQFIFEQNTIAHIQSAGYSVRAFSPKDAGEALYFGSQTLKDGNQILLLRKGDIVLAKSLSPEESVKVQSLATGSVLTLNRTGKI